MAQAVAACVPRRSGIFKRDGRPAALGAVACGMLSVQLGAVLAKLLFPVLGAPGTASLRVLLACLVLLPALGLGSRRPVSWPDWHVLGSVLAYGACLGAMNTMFYVALARLPLGVTVAIEFIGPLSLAVLGSRRPVDLLWIALAVGGLLLLLQPWRMYGPAHRLDPLGVLLALAAGLSWALYILAGRRLSLRMGGIAATTLGMAVASLMLLPFAAHALPLALSRPRFLLAAGGMAVLSSAIPYTIEMMAMRRMSTRGFSILMSLEPAIAALAGLVLLGEHLSPLRWLAIAGIIAASLGSAATDPMPQPPSDA